MPIKNLSKIAGDVLRIRNGEWLIVGLMQLQIFLTITVLLMAKPAASGVFLANYGAAQLPWMYLLTALVAGVVSYLYALSMARYSFLRVNLWTLCICLLSLLLFAILEPLPPARRVVAIGLYTWVGVFGVLAASQFWMMANLVFDVRQAKRLFGLIGAGAISGGIAGGYLASLLASIYGVNNLLFGASLLLLPCLLISWYVWKRYVPKLAKESVKPNEKADAQASPAQLIRGSKHLQLLSGIIALSVVTAKLVEFQFSSYAALRFQEAEKLTSFFGFWFSTFNIIGLTLQVFFTHRIFQRFGVGKTLLILPAGLSVSSIVMFIIPGLNVATISRLIDGSLKQSLLRVGIEMLFVPVSVEVKRRVKTYLDVMVDTVAGGLGGLLLLILMDVFHLSLDRVSLFILFFSGAWLGCTLLMRLEYLNTFRNALSEFWPNEKPVKSITNHRKLLAGLLRIVQAGSGMEKNDQLLFALSREEIVDLKEFKRPLLRLLKHASPAIRAAALHNLSNWRSSKMHLRMGRFLNEPYPEVRKAALDYLVTHDPQANEARINKMLVAEDPSIVITGIRSAIATRNPGWVPQMVGLLSDARFRPIIKRGLSTFGEELLITLRRFLEASPPDVEDARHLPALLKAMNSKKAVALLLSLVELYYPKDLELRKEVYRALNTLQRKHNGLKLPVKRTNQLLIREMSLVELMEESIDLQRRLSIGEREEIKVAREGFVKLLARRQVGNLSRLFRLLGLKYPATDIVPIYRALTEKEGRHRAGALELLDNLLKPTLRKQLIPLLDRVYSVSKKQIGMLEGEVNLWELEMNQIKIFERLLAGEDVRLKLAAIYLIGQINEKRCIPMLNARLEDSDGRVVGEARRTLARLA